MKKYGFNPTTKLKDGLTETLNWYTVKSQFTENSRYNVFNTNVIL